jgi:hypothetical protein
MSNDSLFGALASHEKKTNEGSKSFLYCHIDAYVKVVMFLLLWWKEHEKKFPNVEFLAQQIFYILIQKLRPKHIFNICGAIMTLFNNVRLVWRTLTN